jgi:tripartite-type tricarboxylate transporter receptor subunit TctC
MPKLSSLNNRRRLLKLAGAASLFSSIAPQAVLAQSSSGSGRPITLVVPFPPGAGTDSLARELAQHLSVQLGRNILVDNKGGAGGAIATAGVAKAPADGNTLLFLTSSFVTHAASDPSVSYDILKDFSSIAMLGRGPLMVVSSLESGIKSLSELNARAQAHPGLVTYCSAGPGSINHLAGQMYALQAGISMTHVPYKGSGPALVDLLAGRTQIFFSTVPTIRAQLKEGRVNLLALTSKERSPLFPDTPTVSESGLPAYAASTWWGIGGPAGLASEFIANLNAAINAVSPKLGARLESEGASLVQISPQAFHGVMAQELKNWKSVVASM